VAHEELGRKRLERGVEPVAQVGLDALAGAENGEA
jgi:hypothetical protein